MIRLLLRSLACLVLLLPSWCRAEDSPPDFSKTGVAFLKQHCLECHSGDKPKAELSLSSFLDNGSVVRKRAWINASINVWRGEWSGCVSGTAVIRSALEIA